MPKSGGITNLLARVRGTGDAADRGENEKRAEIPKEVRPEEIKRPCSFEAASNMEIKVAIRVKVLVSPLPPWVYCSLENLFFLSLPGLPSRRVLPVLLPLLPFFLTRFGFYFGSVRRPTQPQATTSSSSSFSSAPTAIPVFFLAQETIFDRAVPHQDITSATS